MPLPTELMALILTFVPSGSLFDWLGLVDPILDELLQKEAIDRFKTGQLCLRLCFLQESHWRLVVDMTLETVTDNECSFIPCDDVARFSRFYTSKLLRQPQLRTISLVEKVSKAGKRRQCLAARFSKDVNMLDRPYPLVIKRLSKALTVGPLGPSLLRVGYACEPTPPQVLMNRPGERWIQIQRFDCDLSWLWKPSRTPWWHKLARPHLAPSWVRGILFLYAKD
ncbi:hypothetical protein DM01DRAFT_1339774 [Hesseltinella vesiculosa]|uniref:F-box domain-containing protein n=1 Tax=Hesseltinella vesiculosa TaxID=101127 RepID=A0A1X2G6A9_9FUNG|nr:hypothetical protein DM01DRAFT_1339774 [Hesseltinella vesiculosa]